MGGRKTPPGTRVWALVRMEQPHGERGFRLEANTRERLVFQQSAVGRDVPFSSRVKKAKNPNEFIKKL